MTTLPNIAQPLVESVDSWPRRFVRFMAFLLCLLALAINVSSCILFFVASGSEPMSWDWYLANLSMRLVCFVVPLSGLLVVIRRPDNLIGWMILTVGMLFSVTVFSIDYVQRDLDLGATTFPLSKWAACLYVWIIPLGFGWLAVFPLLFPNGRPPGARWRPVLWLALISALALMFAEGLLARPLSRGPASGIMNPAGVSALSPYLPLARDVGLGLVLSSIVLGFSSLAYRLAHSEGDERQQTKWVALSSVLIVPTFLFAVISGSYETSFWGWWPELQRWEGISMLLLSVAFLSLPITMAVAILKYRLYEIDYIVNRALVYGSLTALLAGMYTASIPLFRLLFEDATGFVSEAGLVLTTLTFGAAFTPVRSRLQAFVDKHFGAAPSRELVSYNDRLRSVMHVLDPVENAKEFLSRSVDAIGAKGGAISLFEDGKGDRVVAATHNWNPDDEWKRVLMRDGERVVGYLALGGPQRSRAYSNADEETLQSSADLLAQALILSKRKSTLRTVRRTSRQQV